MEKKIKKDYIQPQTEEIIIGTTSLLSGSVNADLDEERQDGGDWDF